MPDFCAHPERRTQANPIHHTADTKDEIGVDPGSRVPLGCS
jgi:hypothetical protein